MITKIIAIGLIVGLLSLGQNIRAAGPKQRAARNATFTRKHRVVATQPASLVFRPEVSGVIPRAIRGGDPLQMLNPFAPAKYGTAEENVVLNPDVPGKVEGIKLVHFTF